MSYLVQLNEIRKPFERYSIDKNNTNILSF